MQAYKILMVDDIENNRFTLDIMLSVLGDFDVDEAESGQEALDKLAESHYDLVLLDIMMPGMTGLEVLEALDLATSALATKFIVVSALQDMETIVKALELGALDYLPKPIEEALLGARIKQLLERRETDAALKQHRERIDTDLKRAAEIQKSLCPAQPLYITDSVGGTAYALSGIMLPAYEVGGDFFDYFTLPNGNLVVVIADACGKGAPAAIYATRVHDLLRLVSRYQSVETLDDAERSLTEMLDAVNSALSENNEACWFVTAWVGVLSVKNHHMYWCSAGHCEALLQDNSGKVTPLTSESGLPLGLDERISIPVSSVLLEPGSRIHLYTDGITEHRQADGQFLNLEGYARILEEAFHTDSDPASQTQRAAEKVMGLNPTLSPEDDVTMLTLLSTRE